MCIWVLYPHSGKPQIQGKVEKAMRPRKPRSDVPSSAPKSDIYQNVSLNRKEIHCPTKPHFLDYKINKGVTYTVIILE